MNRESEEKRLNNLGWAERAVKSCRHKHFVEDYIPGQAVYNLGEYPGRVSSEPTEYDFQQFRKFREHGVGLIQLHEDWNDSVRRYGADKFSSVDPDGLKQLIALAHSFGIKVIPYISTGFFQKTDPDFREDFIRCSSSLRSMHFDYASCSPASPGWRAYLFDKLQRLLDEFPMDRLFNDMGYDGLSKIFDDAKATAAGDDGLCSADRLNSINDEVCRKFTPDMLPYDPYLADILLQVASLVHERKGIYKVHFCMNFIPQVYQKFYDYYWVGECVSDIRFLKQCRDYPPYLIPCPDYYFAKPDEEAFFAMTLPYMQFPLFAGGRPITGERAKVPGVEYPPRELNPEYDYYLKVNDWYRAHPEGPHVYGGQWYGTEGREGTQERWFKFFDLYRPMVSRGSWCYLEIKEADFIRGVVPEDVVISLFANEKRYVVAANHGEKEQEIAFNGRFVDRETGEPVTICRIQPMRMKMFEVYEG